MKYLPRHRPRTYLDEVMTRIETRTHLREVLENGGWVPIKYHWQNTRGYFVFDSEGVEYAVIKDARKLLMELLDEERFVEEERFIEEPESFETVFMFPDED